MWKQIGFVHQRLKDFVKMTPTRVILWKTWLESIHWLKTHFHCFQVTDIFNFKVLCSNKTAILSNFCDNWKNYRGLKGILQTIKQICDMNKNDSEIKNSSKNKSLVKLSLFYFVLLLHCYYSCTATFSEQLMGCCLDTWHSGYLWLWR